MTDNLPAVRPTAEVATADTDSWIQVVGDVARLSDHIATTEFVPRNLRGKAPAVAAAILYGREVGLPPMTALTQTHVIEGKPSMSAEAMRALVIAAGHEIVIPETTGAICVMRGRRRGSDTWTEITWTIDMARAAGLMGKDNWKNYPRQMLQARATAELIRLVFPDVIHGFRAVEELDETGEADDASSSGFDQQTTTVQRTTRKRTAKKPAQQLPPPKPAQRQAPAGPPLPGEPGFDDTGAVRPVPGDPEMPDDPVEQDRNAEAAERAHKTAGEEVAQEPAEPVTDEAPERGGEAAGDSSPAPTPPASVTRAQLRMLHASFGNLGLGDDGERLERLRIVSGIVGHEVESTSNLTKDEASAVIDTLGRCKSLADVLALIDTEDQS